MVLLKSYALPIAALLVTIGATPVKSVDKDIALQDGAPAPVEHTIEALEPRGSKHKKKKTKSASNPKTSSKSATSDAPEPTSTSDQPTTTQAPTTSDKPTSTEAPTSSSTPSSSASSMSSVVSTSTTASSSSSTVLSSSSAVGSSSSATSVASSSSSASLSSSITSSSSATLSSSGSSSSATASTVSSLSSLLSSSSTTATATIITSYPSSFYSPIPISSFTNTANPPAYTKDVGSPGNHAQIPNTITCAAQPAKGKFAATAARTYAQDDILNAVQQGARYKLSPPLPASSFTPPKKGTFTPPAHQVAGNQKYPHDFGKNPKVPKPGTPASQIDSVTPLTAAGCAGNLQEFPIMPKAVYQGATINGPAPDLDRVLFAVDPVTKSTVYCGMMTHGGKDGNAFDDCR